MKMDDTKEAGKKMSIIKEILQWVQAILFAIIVALLLRAFVFEPVYVDGPSMMDTMVTGDRLIVYKLGYYFSPPKRGDIVVLKVKEGSFSLFPFLDKVLLFKKAIPNLDEIDYIKRVIGLPGDKVDIREGFVYVNDEKYDEPYILGNTNKYSGEYPFVVEEGKYFVLGDNREHSKDSRHIGLIDIENIKGKAVFRMWPLKKLGSIN